MLKKQSINNYKNQTFENTTNEKKAYISPN